MQYQGIIIQLIVVTLGVYQVTAECHLTKEQVEGETRVFAIKDTEGVLVPMRKDTIASGEKIFLICNDESVVTVACKKNGQFNATLPIKQCAKPIKATVEVGEYNDELDCTTYLVGYKYRGELLVLYETCYNVAKMQAILSTETAYPYSLVTSRPNSQFTLDGLITGADANTFKSANIYERFNLLLGKGQTYIKNAKDYAIHRGHLTPSGDFLFGSQMSATFKHINVVPQFGSINIANWKSIETWVRQYVETAGELSVITGGLEVLELLSTTGKLVPIYLATGNRNPVPKWMFKIVSDDSNDFIFLTYNNIYDDTEPSPPSMCKTVTCPIELNQSAKSGFTFCCDSKTFQKSTGLLQ